MNSNGTEAINVQTFSEKHANISERKNSFKHVYASPV